ncbi:MAG: TonB-dependent receptor plug domain-containing protein [Thermoanaerobaculales bacterium]
MVFIAAVLFAATASTPTTAAAPSPAPQEISASAPGSSEAANEGSEKKKQPAAPPIHEEIQVTATRYEEDSFRTPIPISVISADQLQRDMPAKMVDELKMLPGVDISGEGPFRGLPVIRGMSSNRVLILVDGQRLNNSRESTEFAGIQPGLVDLSQVERIEVVRGPASVLYGSDAIGGVINIITKQQAFTQGAFTLGGALNYEYSDSASSNRGQLALNGAGERVTFHFSASDFDAKNYSSPEGVVPNSGMKQRAFDGNMRYLVSDNAVLRLDVQTTQARDVGFPGYDPATSGIDISFPRFDRNKVGLTYDSGPVLGLSSLSVGGYWQGVVKDSILDFNFGPTFFSDNFTHSVINTWGFNLHSGADAGPNRLTFGLDFYQDNLHDDTQESSILGSDTNVAVPNSYQRGLGLYVQDELPVTSRLKLMAGVRGDRYSFASRNDPRYTGEPFDLAQSAGSGNLSALYQVTDSVALTALVGRGFRAPNIEERSFFGVDTTGTVLIEQNPQLRSETSLNSEVGFKVRYQQWAGGFNIYRNAARDFIDLVYTGTDPSSGLLLAHFGNIDRATIEGAEFELSWFPSQRWTAFGNVAYSRGTDDQTDQPLALIAPLKGVLGLRYQRTNWWGEAAARMVARQDRVPQGQAQTPGFAVLDLRGGYSFSDGLMVQAAVENAGNTAYIEPFNTHLEQGRDYRLMLGYRF